MSLEEDIKKWDNEKPLYEALAKHIQNLLNDLLYRNGISAKIETRVKDDLSLIKKLNKKQHEDSAYTLEKMIDKCGARVICRFKRDIPNVCSIIDENFEVKKTQDFYEELEFNTQGYKSIHKDVKLKNIEYNNAVFEKLKDLFVEIQIRTLCDNVWADIYHDLGYKPEKIISVKIKRELHCLGGLLETADNCFSLINNSIINSKELTQEFVLNYLESPFFQLFRSRFDPDYSQENLNFLLQINPFDSVDSFKSIIGDFIRTNKEKIAQIADERRNDLSNPLITQPEVILIFYLIDTDRYKLRREWERNFNLKYLVQLSTWWNKPVLK